MKKKDKLILKKKLKDPCLYPGCENLTPTDYPWCKVHKADKFKLPFEPIRKGSKIVLGVTSNVKGIVCGYTFQDVNGHPQMFYTVQLETPLVLSTMNNVPNVQAEFILVHPDNMKTLADQKRKDKEEKSMDGIVEIGQSDNSFQIKTNAPGSQIELVKYKIVRRGALTAKKMVKRLKKLGWRASLVEKGGI